LKYLTVDPKTCFPEEMFNFLKDSLHLPVYAIRHFGLCLELGYTFDQIRETFQFDPAHLSVNNDFFKEKPLEESNYLVFCMEAAYGRKKHNSDRRWNVEHFFDLAERAYNSHNVKAVFIGISELPELPDRSYFIDLRRKLNLGEIVRLLHFSSGYVGNDTGPLHMANLIKKKSIGTYFREDSLISYHPIFPQYNKIFFKPQGPEEIYQSLAELLQ
jgi:ADP-heptose:LPS heptosyltransferase